MALDARDLENAAFLSDAAYQTSVESLSSYLGGSFWKTDQIGRNTSLRNH